MEAAEIAEVVAAIVAAGGSIFALVRLAIRGLRHEVRTGFASNHESHTQLRNDHKELREDQVEQGKAIVRIETRVDSLCGKR